MRCELDTEVSMTASLVTLDREDAVAIVRLNLPDRRNALSLALMRELTDVARDLAEDQECRAIVLAGAGEAFCAGLDLGDSSWRREAEMDLEAWRTTLRRGADMCAAWSALPQMTVAAIERYAIGGGGAIAIALDWRVIGRGAFIVFPEIEIGLNLAWRALPRLTSLVGPARAKRIAILCERLSAEEALSWGLVDVVCDDAMAVDRALEMARQAAAMPAAPARMTKATVDAIADALLPLAAHMDADQAALCFESPEFRDTLDAFSRRARS
jgi:enoyl-CoA hydratase